MSKQEPDVQAKAQLSLQKIYIKDLSFESPKAVEYFAALKDPPEINLQLNTETRKLSEDGYEITLSISVTAKLKGSENVMYLAEVKQAGLFSLSNFPPNELSHVVNTYCLNILFPYAREAVSGMVERGGFPQLLLAPINFDALYQEHMSRLKATNAAPTDAKH